MYAHTVFLFQISYIDTPTYRWFMLNVEHTYFLGTGIRYDVTASSMRNHYLRLLFEYSSFRLAPSYVSWQLPRSQSQSCSLMPGQCRFLAVFLVQGRHEFEPVLLQHSQIHVHGISLLHWRMCSLAWKWRYINHRPQSALPTSSCFHCFRYVRCSRVDCWLVPMRYS